jgi:AcrR family transcriptional regulator
MTGPAPQQERSRLTRARLLDAAVASLSAVGWAGTTVAVVAARAGVSRGASQHHFATRESLFTATVNHIAQLRLAELAEPVAGLPTGVGRTEAVLSRLVAVYTGPLFRAALQIWAAAASDPVLRGRIVPLEAELGRLMHQHAVRLLGADERVPGVREAVQASLDLARGLGLADVLTDDARRRRAVLQQWARTLDAVLAGQDGGIAPNS